jgi:bifunctional non-homologous end joining protein LigD
MLSTEGSVAKLKKTQWAFEGKWDGYRVLVDADHGNLCVRSRRGRDVTGEFRQFEALAADLADHHVILDGEAVALDDTGVPSFSLMQNRARSTRVEFWAFDILQLDGRSLLRAKYSDRRRILETLADGGGVIVPDQLPGDGPEALDYARAQRWEGVVAKRRDSTYQPGRRSASWIKDKIWNTQEVVIGGWREGTGGRSSGIGSLVLGIPGDGGLVYVGRVGTGFTEKDLSNLKKALKPLETDESIRTPRVSRSSGQNSSARSATANGRAMTDCASRVGVVCDRTSHPMRWCGSDASTASCKPLVANWSANSLSATPECPLIQNHSTWCRAQAI